MPPRKTTKSSALLSLDVLQDPQSLPEKPVYAVFGNEEFLRLASLDAIKNRILGEDGDEFAVARYEGKTASLADVLDELSTVPFLSRRRLVILVDADDFVSAHRLALEAYMEKPSRHGVLVIMAQSWPSNTRLAKAVGTMGAAIDCRVPDARKLVSWCRGWAETRYGKKLERDAADLLLELVPNSVGQLDQEIGKLAAYVSNRAAIKPADVDTLVASGKVELVWNILDAATAGDSGRAIAMLDSLYSAGEHPLMVLGALSAQLRRLAKAYRFVESGQQIRSALISAGIREFVVAKAQSQMRHLGKERLLALYHWLLQADLGLKGESNLSPQHVLERLIVRVAL